MFLQYIKDTFEILFVLWGIWMWFWVSPPSNGRR